MQKILQKLIAQYTHTGVNNKKRTIRVEKINLNSPFFCFADLNIKSKTMGDNEKMMLFDNKIHQT